MAYSIVKRQVREINRRLFAIDKFYVDNDTNDTFTAILSDIIQTFSPDDMLSNTPIILEIKDSNITEQTLDKLKLLSKQSVYLQFNNRSLADTLKLNIIRSLKESGYKIIVEINKEDTMFNFAKLLADIIKLNIKEIPQAFSNGSGLLQCKVLAYNINTPEDYVMAENIGISLYEGEYISEATSIQIPQVKHSNVGFIHLLSLINTKSTNINEIVDLIKKDTLLVAQILRLANSKYCNSSTKISVDNIAKAVVQIGLQNLKRWLLLLEFGRNDNPREDILKSSYYRALICERIAIEKNGIYMKPGEAYLIGILSQLDILSAKPMANELAGMALTDIVEKSLVYRDTAGGAMLNLIIAFEEHNDIQVEKYCEALGIKRERLSALYTRAVIDAKNTWKEITEFGGVYL